MSTGVLELIPAYPGASQGYYGNSVKLKKPDGYYRYGKHDSGEVGNGTNVTDVTTFTKMLLPKGYSFKLFASHRTSNGYNASSVAVTTDNRVYGWGDNTDYGITQAGVSNIYVPREFTPRSFYK